MDAASTPIADCGTHFGVKHVRQSVVVTTNPSTIDH